VKLYSNTMSSNSKRARVCIAELGIAVDVHEVNFGTGEHKSAGYMKLNPNGKVPTFVDDDGTTLWESRAILVYLSEKYGKLRPTDARGKAEQFRWMFWSACHYSSAIGALSMEKMIKPTLMSMEPDPRVIEAEMKNLDRFAPVLEEHLDRKDWIVGKEFTIADIDVAVACEVGTKVGLDLAKYPHTRSWFGRVSERPSWRS
jgi:glutathione S-transferase